MPTFALYMKSVARLRIALSERYILKQELGRGGMGTVFLAQDKKHGRDVAIKLLHPELATSVGAERFLQEIRTTSQLSNPHILALHDSGEVDGLLYYIMPYVKGESLRELLKRQGRLPLPLAVQITLGVLSGLEYAHAHGIVHRDIKPENILLTERNHPLIADFGLARALTHARDKRLTATGITVGSPTYMSPEQGSGESNILPSADLYSLGCVLYEMLAGAPPYTGATVQAVIHQHNVEPPPSIRTVNPDVPVSVDLAIRKAMSKTPAERFASASEFAHVLDAWVPVSPSGNFGGRSSSAHRTVFSRRTSTVLGLFLLLAAIALGAWKMWRDPPARMGDPERPRIAVMYFEDRTPQKDLGYLADGITETLIQELGRLEEIEVVSENGVRPYRAVTVTPDSVASALNAQLLISGRVQRSGDRLRVGVSITDAQTGAEVRGKTFERPWGEVFALMDTVLVDVSAFLREELGREIRIRRWKNETKNTDAWRMVLQAQELNKQADKVEVAGMLDGMSEILRAADSLLIRAQELDPKWQEPIVQRAKLSLRQATIALQLQKTAEVAKAIEDGLRLADSAVAQNAGAAAFEVRGDLRYWKLMALPPATPAEYEEQLASVESDLRQAVVLDPGRARVWSRLAAIMYDKGQFREANQAARKALVEDAYLRGADETIYLLFLTHFELGEDAEAQRWCEQVQQRVPNPGPKLMCRFQLMVWSPTDTLSSQTAWRLLRGVPGSEDLQSRIQDARHMMLLAGALAGEGLTDSARVVLERAHQLNPVATLNADWEAAVRLILKEPDAARRLLKAHLEAWPTERARIRHSRLFRPLQQDSTVFNE
jgi:eukaryotic-like serine/threonine-protein kinase